MIVLYHCESARSFRPLWALEELGLACELRMLPFPPRVHAKDYLQVNPLGTIPAFFDGDTRMTESAAICQYLASRYGDGALDVPRDAREYGAYLNWLHFGEATLTFPQTLVLRYGRLEPADRRQPQVVDDYGRWFLARLRAVEAVVGEQPYLCGERFTAADISVGYALMLAHAIGLAARFPPGVEAYWQRLSARAGYRRALARQRSAAEAAGLAPFLEQA
jgi:glutathione S-transferase